MKWRWPWQRGPKPEETRRTLDRADQLQADLRRVVTEARVVLVEQERLRDQRRAKQNRSNRGGAGA